MPASPDDREYPAGLGNDARLMRWVKDNVPDQHVRSEGTEPVTMTGGELFDLLYRVADWAYRNATDDVAQSPQRITEFFANTPAEPWRERR